LAHVVSSLGYPNLLETKRLGCYCTLLLLQLEHLSGQYKHFLTKKQTFPQNPQIDFFRFSSNRLHLKSP
jgi:hypothetical protein